MLRCPKCKATLPDNPVSCNKCGVRFKPRATAQSPQSTQRASAPSNRPTAQPQATASASGRPAVAKPKGNPVIVVLVVLLIAAVAFGGYHFLNNQGGGNMRASLAGKWVAEQGDINFFGRGHDIEFSSDGIVYVYYNSGYRGEWTDLGNGSIRVSGRGSVLIFTYKISRNSLSLTDEDGDSATFRRE